MENDDFSKTSALSHLSFDEGIGTNPDELVAAALAGCFSMAFAKELILVGLHPHFIESTAIASADEFIAGPVISHLQLDVRATVPDATQAQFVHAALAAKASSPVARLLKTTISMTAHLEVDR